MRELRTFTLIFALALTTFVRAQFAIKNNVLYDAALTPNLGVEYRLPSQHHWTYALSLAYSPFQWGTDTERRWRHVLVMPEARYWFCEAYSRNFVSINAVYSRYNAAKLDLPIYGTKDYRYDGQFVGLGTSWGYDIPFGKNKNFNLEFEVGADLCYTWFDKYECDHCGNPLGSDNKWFVLPKLGVNLAWLLPLRDVYQDRWYACECDYVEEGQSLVNIPYVAPEERGPFVPAMAAVLDNTGKGGALQKDNPIVHHISDYRPYTETMVLRKQEGMLYVHFEWDNVILKRDFRNNAQILDNIVDITRQIMADSISSVKKIQIVGMASIEGTVEHNCWLGENRAKALQDYVEREVPGTSGLFELGNGCEAWSEFIDQLEDVRALKQGRPVRIPEGSPVALAVKAMTPDRLEGITLEELNQAIEIARNEPNADRREQRIRRLNDGRTYAWIKKYVLADQRNSGYLRIFYDYVPDAAAQTINQATSLLQEGDSRAAEALALLRTVENDPRSLNALGVALYQTGHRNEAIEAWRKSDSPLARQNLKQIENK